MPNENEIILKEIFGSGELEEDSVIRKIRITAADGKKYPENIKPKKEE